MKKNDASLFTLATVGSLFKQTFIRQRQPFASNSCRLRSILSPIHDGIHQEEFAHNRARSLRRTRSNNHVVYSESRVRRLPRYPHKEENPIGGNDSQTRRRDSHADFNKHLNAHSVFTHTTATSQFLYGSSTVQAALAAKKREFYKLYLGPGSLRRLGRPNNNAENGQDAIVSLAQTYGLRVTRLQPIHARLMDEISSGRPHNVRVNHKTTDAGILKGFAILAATGSCIGGEFPYSRAFANSQ
jgi:hypothetical protein